MFGRRFTLFHVMGFEIKADPSWFVIAALIVWSLSAGLFPLFFPELSTVTYWLMGLAGAFGLFFSILFHELSHSVVGRRFGMEIEGITLWIFGGIAEMTRDADRPRTEFLMAAAGPASSFVLAGVFYLLAVGGTIAALPVSIVGVLGYLAWLNLILAIFNLLPAFPLDGGRILRSALWARLGIVTATRISAGAGSVFGWLLIGLGILAAVAGNIVGGVWWILIGAFIRFAAKASLRHFVSTRLLSDAPVEHMMTPNPPSIAPDTPIAKFVNEYVFAKNGSLYPVGHNGKVLGMVDIDSVNKVPRSEWATRTVGELTQALTRDAVIDPSMDAVRALEVLQRSGRRSLIVSRNGTVAGTVSLDDLDRYIRRRAALGDMDSKEENGSFGVQRRPTGSSEEESQPLG